MTDKEELKMHNEKFAALQDEYYANGRDKETLGKMYEVICEYLRNRIRKYCRDRNLRLDVEDKTEIGAVWIIERYLRNPNFKIERISAYGHFGLLKALYSNIEEEKAEVSLDALVDAYEKGERANW